MSQVLASCGDDAGVRACLAEKVPLLREVVVKISFRQKGLSPESTIAAAKGQVAEPRERVDAATAAGTMDIFRHKAGLSRAFSNKPEPIGITGNLHFGPSPYMSRAGFGWARCITTKQMSSNTTRV